MSDGQTFQEIVDHWRELNKRKEKLDLSDVKWVILVAPDIPDEILEIVELEAEGKATDEQWSQCYHYFRKRAGLESDV